MPPNHNLGQTVHLAYVFVWNLYGIVFWVSPPKPLVKPGANIWHYGPINPVNCVEMYSISVMC